MRTKTPLQAEKILAVAARLFATHHFHQARMEDIAAAAEVGKGTLYRYFKDKEELYLALLDQAADQLPVRMRQADNPDLLGPRERLVALVGAVIDYFDEQHHLFDLIQHAEVMGSMDRDIPWNQTRQEIIALFKSVFADGEQRGLFHFADPHLSVLLLLGGIRAVMRFTDRPLPADLPRRLIDCFLEGHLACAAPQVRSA